MLKQYDAAVIGGGIVGTSILYHLCESGFRKVILLEKEKMLGTGSTAKSAGGIRHQFSNIENILMTIKSIKIFREIEKKTGINNEFRKNGYLIFASTDSTMNQLAVIAENLKKLKIDFKFLEKKEIKKNFPHLNVTDLKGGLLTPGDGYLDPHTILYSFTSLAKKKKAVIKTSSQVIKIKKQENGTFLIEIAPGDIIKSEIVINAAGPWIGDINKLVDVDLPHKSCKRQIFVSSENRLIPRNSPLTIDFNNPFYFRPEGETILLSASEKKDVDEKECIFEWNETDDLVKKAIHRVPAFENLRLKSGWAGLRTITPDHNAIIGESETISGFYIAGGFSGHGVMHSASSGKLLADIIKGKCIKDISYTQYLPERFAHKNAGFFEKGVI